MLIEKEGRIMEAEKPIFSEKALIGLVVPLVLEQILGITVGMAAQIIIFHSICAMLLWPTGFSLPKADGLSEMNDNIKSAK